MALPTLYPVDILLMLLMFEIRIKLMVLLSIVNLLIIMTTMNPLMTILMTMIVMILMMASMFLYTTFKIWHDAVVSNVKSIRKPSATPRGF